MFCLQTLPTMNTSTGGTRKEGTLSEFDQEEFFEDRAADVSMDSEGFIYVPERFVSSTASADISSPFCTHLHTRKVANKKDTHQKGSQHVISRHLSHVHLLPVVGHFFCFLFTYRCKSATCNLHLHFHGCGMGRSVTCHNNFIVL